MAYDFARRRRRVPDDYAELLDDAGVKAQARAPMTPIVKLVFGADYDKTRLTEFAAALAYAERVRDRFRRLPAVRRRLDGGLKGLVAAERKARRRRAARRQPADDGPRRASRRAPAPLARFRPTRNSRWSSPAATPTAVEAVQLVADLGLLEKLIRRAAPDASPVGQPPPVVTCEARD